VTDIVPDPLHPPLPLTVMFSVSDIENIPDANWMLTPLGLTVPVYV
jgi:hypothetical protein